MRKDQKGTASPDEAVPTSVAEPSQDARIAAQAAMRAAREAFEEARATAAKIREDARQAYAAAIRQARADGLSLNDVAREAGTSRAAVAEILRETREDA